MGGMSSTNSPSYSQSSPGGQNKMTSGSPQYTPASTSQYTQPRYGQQAVGKMPGGAPQYTPQQTQFGQAGQYAYQPGGYGTGFSQNNQAVAPGTGGSGINPALLNEPSQNNQAIAPGTGGRGIPPKVEDRYMPLESRLQQQPTFPPIGLNTAFTPQNNAPFQTQQFMNNIQQGAGALSGPQQPQLGQAGQYAYQPEGQPETPQFSQPEIPQFPQPKTPQVFQNETPQVSRPVRHEVALGTGALSVPPQGGYSQMMNDFNQARGYGGGMSRGKGFRSGGAVHEISDEDVQSILKALSTARKVVKDGE